MRQGRIHIGWLLALCAGLSIASCEPSSVESKPDKMARTQISAVSDKGSDQHKVAIYVTSNGWHSGIVVGAATVDGTDGLRKLYIATGQVVEQPNINSRLFNGNCSNISTQTEINFPAELIEADLDLIFPPPFSVEVSLP